MVKLSSDTVTEVNAPDDFADSSAADSATDPSVPSGDAGVPRVPGAAEWRRLDPRYIPFQRNASLIAAAIASIVLLAGAITLWLGSQAPPWADALLVPSWLLLTALLAWSAYAWPPLDYRHTAYLLDDHGIEIRAGVVWRTVMNVPRSRVQHIDVSQGPLERAYGLGRLVIYTAGTDHSRVELPGLAYAVALALRDRLLPKGQDDAV
jgi:hypothetical protein